jgi:hypothetical protein
MVLAARPVSANAKRQQSRWYTELLASSARACEPRELSGPLYVRIIWFQRRPTTGDVDNIVKRILDALKGIVFHDDEDIERCSAVKTVADLSGTFALDPVMLPSAPILLELAASLRAEDHTLYVEIGPVTDPMVVFGPVR